MNQDTRFSQQRTHGLNYTAYGRLLYEEARALPQCASGPDGEICEAWLVNEELDVLRRVMALLQSTGDAADAAAAMWADRAAYLIPLRARAADVEGLSLDRHALAFDALELSIRMCFCLAVLNQRHLPERDDLWDVPEDQWFELALGDLFASGILLASEVLALLRAGYTTGALARWRALHETTVKAEFISQGGVHLAETAKRYLIHEELRETESGKLWKGLLRKEQTFPNLELLEEMLDDWERETDELVSQFDRQFRQEYGWAHDQLSETSPSYRRDASRGKRDRGPTLGDLDRAIQRDPTDIWPTRWRYLCSLANAAVHGSPHSLLAYKDGRLVARMAPEVDGSTDAGEATAQRLKNLLAAWDHPDFGPGEDLWTPRPLVVLTEHLCDMAESAFANKTLA